ncbi:MAG TPA: substrate-binding domain-containing protein [Gaiellaceae bacterium]|jgi:ribose transport system substrate-binding protein
MKRDHARVSRRPVILGTAIVLALALPVALGVATPGASSAPTRATAACGTLPVVAPKDPAKTLARATARAKSYYNGWPFPLQRSALRNWKPNGKPPYTIGVLFDGLGNPFQAYVYNVMQKALKASPSVGKVIAVVGEAGNPTKEVQAYQSLVQQGADLIIVQPTSAPAFLPVVKSALARGVATIAYINPLSNAAAVSIGPNVYTSAGAALAAFLKQHGGKGDLLGVHGIRVTPVDQSTWAVFKPLLAACPNAHLVGEIDGNFAPPAVRAAVLQFLATHPGNIDGVFQTATMGPSIIGAFQQAGRSVPPVTAMAAQKGEIAYWSDNAGKGYKTIGFAGGPTSIVNLVTRVAFRMLAGQGPKTTDIPWPQPLITPANLKQYAKSGWTSTTPGTVEQPRSTFWRTSDLNSLFTFPNRKLGGRAPK